MSYTGVNIRENTTENYKLKFKVGDRVISTCANSTYGMYGNIINISQINSKIFYLVEFDESISFLHSGNINTKIIVGEKAGKEKHCWYIDSNHMIKVETITNGINAYNSDIFFT